MLLLSRVAQAIDVLTCQIPKQDPAISFAPSGATGTRLGGTVGLRF